MSTGAAKSSLTSPHPGLPSGPAGPKVIIVTSKLLQACYILQMSLARLIEPSDVTRNRYKMQGTCVQHVR